MAEQSQQTTVTASSDLEGRITTVSENLARSLDAVVSDVTGNQPSPQLLASRLGLDKVLSSRILKTLRHPDPLAVAHMAPGPEPLRRVLRAASKRGADAELLREAHRAVDAFEQLIRRDAGDRSALETLLSAWAPELRSDFELRRKQTAFRAMSQLKGVSAELDAPTVFLHPSDEPGRLDVVWLAAIFGVQRLWDEAPVKFSTRRTNADPTPRHPTTLDGEPVEGLAGLRLDEFCSKPLAPIEVNELGEAIHYMLGGEAFGPLSSADLVFAEVNRAEIDHTVNDPARKPHVFVEVATPVKTLIFTVLVHEDLYPGIEPTLTTYDTSFEGVANPNDPSRDLDRWNLTETLRHLGVGRSRFRTGLVPRYMEMIDTVFSKMDWDAERFRGYRARIEYPIYGSQPTVTFDPAPRRAG